MKGLGKWLGIVGFSVACCLVTAEQSLSQVQPTAVRAAYTLLNRGWVNDAIAAFQRVLRQSPNSLDAKLGLAMAYQRAGQDTAAWTAYQQVLAQDGDNRAALTAVGLLGSYRAEWQAGGITALTRLLQLNPNDGAARTQRALLLGYQGRYAESFVDYQVLLANNPAPAALLGAAQVYSYSGDYGRSLTLFDRYRATGRAIPDGALTAYARTVAETGEPATAIQLLDAKLRQPRVPDWLVPDLRGTLAVAYQANQQPQQALQVLAPLRQQPANSIVLARALHTIGRRSGNAQLRQQAADLYRQALRQTPNPSLGLQMEAADALSELASGRSEALAIYQQLSQQQPGDRSLIVKRLVLERQIGSLSTTELQQQLQATLQPLPDSAIEQQAVAIALTQLDPPLADLLPIYQELLQSEVDAPFLNFRVAQIYLQQGNLADARQALTAYQATSFGQRDWGAELMLAEVDRRDSKLDSSAQRYEAVIAQNLAVSIQQDALFGLANVRREQGKLAQVLPFYQALLAREPDNARSQIGYLNLRYQLNQISDAAAIQELDQWLSQQSPLSADLELLSLVGALPADPEREPLYLSLLELAPANLAVERRLIQVIAQRDPEAARSRMEQVVAGDRGSIAGYFVQGELAQALGDLALADQSYASILQQQPNNTDALSALAGVKFQQKQYDTAAVLYKRVLALKPNDLETQRVLAELYLAQDLPQSGLRQLQQVQQSQEAQGITNPVVGDRVQEVELNFLRRRGLQPYWERY